MRYRLRSGSAAVTVHESLLAEPDADVDLLVDVAPGILRPGLVNAHDHLHRNHYPHLGYPPYADAYAWGRDIHDRYREEIARGRSVDRFDALLFGALKNLIAGATTVLHHDRWEPAFEGDFPVRVVRVPTVHSLGFDPDGVRSAAADGTGPLCIHLAEGTTEEAADEVRQIDALGLLDERLIAVHAVGVDEAGIELLRERRACVVWCPTSNLFLLGRTAPERLLTAVDVLLGSDALLTADGTLLDELRAARALGVLSDDALLEAVGTRAAARLGRPVQELEPGAPADLAVFDRPVLEAIAEDVQLVVVAGVPRLGDVRHAKLFGYAGVEVEELRVGRTTKLVAAPLGSVARRIASEWPAARRIFAAPMAVARSAPLGARA